MKQKLLLFFFLTLLAGRGYSQCYENDEPKVLLVGDSWAWFMLVDSTFSQVFDRWGMSNYTFSSNATIAENGAETDDFQKADKQAEIINQLNANPSIKAIHLSIGGNDFLGDWNVSLSQGAVDTLVRAVADRLDSVVRFLKSTKPDIKIMLSGYVYPNFEEVIHDAGALSTNHPFYGTWSGMGFPTFAQINGLLNMESDSLEIYANKDPQVEYVKATGLMQYLHGQTSPLGVPPGGTYPPFTVPMPFGDSTYPSPKTMMRDYGIFKDCFHLSPAGYRDLIGYQFQKFYHKFMMDDLYLLSENNTQTGTVSSAGATNSTLSLGESSGEQFASVLSFNTTTMADTTLAKASIFLCRQSLTGSNPLTGPLQVKVKNGSFGTTVDVEAADFSATGDATDAPCQFGRNDNDGYWIRLDLPTSILHHITNAAPTQFVVSAPGFTGGKVDFKNSSDPEFAPVLNLKYGEYPSGIKETENKQFSIYPNPTSGLLNIVAGNELITQVEISNLMGQVVLQPTYNNGSINIQALSSGMYLLNITTKTGKTSQRFVKE